MSPGDASRVSPGHRITSLRPDPVMALRDHQVARSPGDPAIALQRDAVTGLPGYGMTA